MLTRKNDAQITRLADRRRTSPWGLEGGENGALGKSTLLTKDQGESLPGKCNRDVAAETWLRIESRRAAADGEILVTAMDPSPG